MYDKFAVMSTQKVEEDRILGLLSRTCFARLEGQVKGVKKKFPRSGSD